MPRNNLAGFLPFCLFLSFCGGIILGRCFPLFWIFFVVAIFSLSLVVFFYKQQKFFLSDISILSLFIFLGALWVIPSSKYKLDDFLHKEHQFSLKVVSLPQINATRNIFYAKIKKVGNISFNQKIKIMDYTRNMEYLGFYRTQGKLSRREYKGRNFYTLWVKKDTHLKQLPAGFSCKLAKLTTNYLLGVFKNNLSEQSYRFLASVFLGRRELLGEEKEILTRVGGAHLLAISGLHIGLTSLILFFILRFFNIRFKARLIISLIFLCFYTFLTGGSPSTLRAAIMYSIFCFSFFLQRKTNLLNSLALAGFIALMVDSSILFNIGFQLSFTAVFAIILGFKIFSIKPAHNSALNYFKYIIFCSFFVTLFIMPLVSYYFGKIYILSSLYNLALIPFFTAILAVNFLLIIFSPLGFIAQSLGAVVSLLVSFFINIVRILGSIKFSFIAYTFSCRGIYIYYFFLAGILLFFGRKNKSKKEDMGHDLNNAQICEIFNMKFSAQ